jgi:hypothetical protein
MPKLSKQVVVPVTDKGRVGDKRKASLEVEAASSLFALSDMLANEGALRDKTVLAGALQEAVGAYIGSGKKLVREVAKGKVRKSERAEAKGKQDKRVGAL